MANEKDIGRNEELEPLVQLIFSRTHFFPQSMGRGGKGSFWFSDCKLTNWYSVCAQTNKLRKNPPRHVSALIRFVRPIWHFKNSFILKHVCSNNKQQFSQPSKDVEVAPIHKESFFARLRFQKIIILQSNCRRGVRQTLVWVTFS